MDDENPLIWLPGDRGSGEFLEFQIADMPDGFECCIETIDHRYGFGSTLAAAFADLVRNHERIADRPE